MNIIHLLYMDNKLNNITKMYEKLTYYDQYGASLILFILITIIVLLLVSYFHTMINVQPIIDDWPNQRCKPNIIPFAGLITHPEGVTATEYTSQNFNYCTQNILSGITGIAVQPLTYATNLLKTFANLIQQSIQSIRAMFDKIRTMFQKVSEEIMGRIMNIMIPLQQIIISFKDLLGKIQGTMTAGLFTVLGSYYTLKSLMGAIAQFIIIILIALAVMIAVFWIVPFTWGAAIANTVIFIAIAIPMAIILAFMVDVLHVDAGYKIPKVKCFDKDTLITMNNGIKNKIININVGDVLDDNNIVTGKIKVATEGSQVYILNNIFVSDSHIVKYENKWIPVSKHPDAIKYNNYKEPYLYCLNTSKKIIKVKNEIFTDWDEIYENSLSTVLNNKIKPINNCNDIHVYLDYGFADTTKIRLKDKTFVNIDKICINDILENGEKVYGIVEINGLDLPENYLYNLGENNYLEGYAPMFNVEKTLLPNLNNKLYNLLTDKGIFKVNNVVLKDYNSAIDRFLENTTTK
jgi:hypothetical protein